MVEFYLESHWKFPRNAKPDYVLNIHSFKIKNYTTMFLFKHEKASNCVPSFAKQTPNYVAHMYCHIK